MIEIIDNKDMKRFLIREDNIEIGYVDYIDDLTLTYLFIHPEFRGQGKGRVSAEAIYQEMIARDKKVQVTCKVLKGILEKDDKYRSILL